MSSEVKLIEDWRDRWEPQFVMRGITFNVEAVFDNGNGKTFLVYKRLDDVIDTLEGSIYLIPKPRGRDTRTRRESETMSGGTCHYCARHDCTCNPPPRYWEPVVGEKVLVEATLTHDKWHRDTVLIAVGDYMNIKVPLSSIRPMRKEGE